MSVWASRSRTNWRSCGWNNQTHHSWDSWVLVWPYLPPRYARWIAYWHLDSGTIQTNGFSVIWVSLILDLAVLQCLSWRIGERSLVENLFHWQMEIRLACFSNSCTCLIKPFHSHWSRHSYPLTTVDTIQLWAGQEATAATWLAYPRLNRMNYASFDGFSIHWAILAVKAIISSSSAFSITSRRTNMLQAF